CGYLSAGDGSTSEVLHVVDQATGAATDVPDIITYARCPAADGNLVAIVRGADGDLVLATGPLTDLQQQPLPVVVSQVGWWAFDAAGELTGLVVWGALPSAPGEIGLYTVDLASGALTTDIPAVPASAAWAPGATPSGSLQSTSVADTLAAVVQFAGYYLYPRAMSDGGTTVFAGPFASGAASELALFQVPDGLAVPIPAVVSPSASLGGYGPLATKLITWQLDPVDGPGTLLVWDDGSRRLTTCAASPGGFLVGTESPDGTKTLFAMPQQNNLQYQGSGPLLLFSSPGAAGTDGCTTLVDADVVTAGFSPDGGFMYWLVQPAAGEGQLWVAAGDGSGAHMIGTGVLQNIHFLASGAQLEMILDGDLVWMDLHDATVNLHYVAEQVYDLIYDLRDGWLIAGYDYSSQDTNGTLGLVNRNTGEKRPISLEVSQFIVQAEGVGADGGIVDSLSDASVGTELAVVYMVRGRNPSAQDGIWTATITAADLQ
ncbi:MAG TPA: hypothetical protein VHC23_03215, partial [Jatrophihabitans sp.]|nr:hypothetical protein [Jatrophihabitans sp.]